MRDKATFTTVACHGMWSWNRCTTGTINYYNVNLKHESGRKYKDGQVSIFITQPYFPFSPEYQ